MYFPSGNHPVGPSALTPTGQLPAGVGSVLLTVLAARPLPPEAAAQLPPQVRASLPRLDGAPLPPEPHLVSVNRGRDTLLLLAGSQVPARAQLQLAATPDGGWQVRQVILPAAPPPAPALPERPLANASASPSPEAAPPTAAKPITTNNTAPSAPAASVTGGTSHSPAAATHSRATGGALAPPPREAAAPPTAAPSSPATERPAATPGDIRATALAALRHWLPRAPSARELLATAPPPPLLEQTNLPRLGQWRAQPAQLAAALMAASSDPPQTRAPAGSEPPELKAWLEQSQARVESTRAQQQLHGHDSPSQLPLPLFSEIHYLNPSGRARLLRSRTRRPTRDGGRRWQLTAAIELGQEQSLIVDLEWILAASPTAGELWARLWSDDPPLREALAREVGDLQSYLARQGISAQVTVERVALPAPPPPPPLVELTA